jgi:predicted lipoprotein with Yx(FWY)xxD motif
VEKTMRVLTLAAVAVTFAAFSGAVAATKPDAKGAAHPAVMATPAGVTLQSVRIGDARTATAMTVYADAEGKTLYTFDQDTTPGQSACVGECEAAWPPLKASAQAAASGDWSIITRADGSRQWALKGKPLYTFAKDEKVGDAKGNNAAQVWHTAVFKPLDKAVFPEGIAAEELVNAPGWALVNARRMTLYTLDGDTGTGKTTCSGACLETWIPLTAPAVANTMGDFAPIARADGVRQWTWRGKPLYLYSGDAEAGDVNGDGEVSSHDKTKKWHAVVLVKHFVPTGVEITNSPRHGAMLATASGMTLYARDANKFSGGGASHADRSVARGTPATGRTIGVKGCDATCAQTWTPFKASAEDQPTGYWSIVTRDDGTRQWAYMGYPLYTYTQDVPGTARGHDIYDINAKIPAAGEAAQTAGAQALYWRVALP